MNNQQMWIKASTRRPRGMALVGTMLVMLILMSVMLVGVLSGTSRGGSGLMNTTGNAIQMSKQQEQSSSAFNLADAGMEYGLQWVHALPKPPANGSEFTVPSSGWSTSNTPPSGTYIRTLASGGSFALRFYPDSQNFVVNNSNPQHRYLIESVGTDASGKQALVRAYVEQTSFGRYAYFTVSQPSNLYWNAATNSFDGPVHFNDAYGQAGDGTKSNVVWLDNTPMFRYMGDDAFSYSSGVNWFHNNTATPQTPGVNDWQSVASFGQGGVQQRPSIALPTSSALQQFAAMGQTPILDSNDDPIGNPIATPLLPGVSLPPGGGIYIKGDVSDMVLSVDGSGSQVINVTQTDNTIPLNPVQIQTTVTLDKGNNRTRVTTVRTPQTGPATTTNTTTTGSTTNGVVYIEGNVGSPGTLTTAGHGLSGTIADSQALTIATPNDATNNTVNVNGNLTYNTPRAVYTSADPPPAGSSYQIGDFKPESDASNANFRARAGTLGLVTNTVQLTDNDAANNHITNLEVDASILAYGTLTAMDYASRPPGKFVCMGGQICNRRGALGQFNSGTLATVSGLPGKYSYDQRLASDPPPFFPTTKNVYKVDSWETLPLSQRLP